VAPEPTYHRQDLPALQLPVEEDLHAVPDQVASDHLRLALIVQEMAAFDRRGGEASRLRQPNEIGRYDFNA
jgi:hypothetical protein